MNNQIIGIKFDDKGNLEKPKAKTIKQKFEKIDDSDKMAILQPKQIEMKNGIHLICRFCGCSHFTMGSLTRHIKLKHRGEFVKWYIGQKLKSVIELQNREFESFASDELDWHLASIEEANTYDSTTYELNQVL